MTTRIHRAWVVAAVTFVTLMTAASFRSSMGVMFQPLEAEFGWTRGDTSAAASLSLILYGLTAPFAASLLQRFQIRQVVAAALTMIATGSFLTVFAMKQSWQLSLFWGGFIGLGTGSIALVFGAIVANRWFIKHRGLVIGAFSASSTAGQLMFLSLVANLVEIHGWRIAAGAVGTAAVVMIPLTYALLSDRPSAVGTTPYGAPADYVEPEHQHLPVKDAALSAINTLRMALPQKPFWILAFTFFVCGWSTNGLIQTHFIPAAHDHGMPNTTAAGLLAVIGIFDMIGTIASGWLTDKYDARWLLVMYYGLRGASLFYLPVVLGPHVEPPMLFFIVFYGLDWVATVPPTVALCREYFGIEKSGVVYGWVFASHMIGAGAGAGYAGWIRTSNGDYAIAWITAGVLCMIAASSMFLMRRRTTGTAEAVAGY
jgi:sugar phosphate permease